MHLININYWVVSRWSDKHCLTQFTVFYHFFSYFTECHKNLSGNLLSLVLIKINAGASFFEPRIKLNPPNSNFLTFFVCDVTIFDLLSSAALRSCQIYMKGRTYSYLILFNVHVVFNITEFQFLQIVYDIISVVCWRPDWPGQLLANTSLFSSLSYFQIDQTGFEGNKPFVTFLARCWNHTTHISSPQLSSL